MQYECEKEVRILEGAIKWAPYLNIPYSRKYLLEDYSNFKAEFTWWI